MYMVTKMQEQQTTGNEGVEILRNEPFENEELGRGQYTSKMYHMQSKAPTWLTTFAPTNSLLLEEEAWNAYPRCKTVLKCPYFTRFKLTVETIHVPDRGHSDNVHNLPQSSLNNRKVEFVDIASTSRDYWSYVIGSDAVDLTTFQSRKTGRGPLTPGWQDRVQPVMTAYKLVTVDAPYWGFGYRLEQLVLGGERALFMESHKQCLAWIDEWCGLTFDDVRHLELQTDRALNMSLGNHGSVGLKDNSLDRNRSAKDTSFKSPKLGHTGSLENSTLSLDDRDMHMDHQRLFSQTKVAGESLDETHGDNYCRVDGGLSSTIAVMM